MGWTERKGKSDAYAMAGCFYQPRVWLFGRDVEDLKLALDVLSGTSPSLSGDNPLRARGLPRGQ